MRQTVFISDCHLQESTPAINTIFIRYLMQLTNIDALYILGDLFEAWIGDDDLTPFHQSIIHALKNLTARGVPVFLLHGNRDFLLGKRFRQKTGIQFLSEHTVIDLYGVKTLLMHGDLLCTDDVTYLAFRRKVRNPLVQFLFKRKSLTKRQEIARLLRQRSQEHQSNAAAAILDVSPTAVKNVFKKYPVTVLIHGHTHRPMIHEDILDGVAVKRIVLNAWHHEGNALVVTEDHQYHLTYFT